MKHVLIITYYWPPSAGGGVQRWLKFAKYLPEFGWNPIIFTPEDPAFGIVDHSLEQEPDKELEVIRFPIWEPYSLAGGNKARKQGVVDDGSDKSLKSNLMVWLRGNLIIPDPKVFWVRSSARFLKTFVNDRKIDAVITTGPPHSMHLIGLKLKKRTGIRWIADFRDPWSEWDMFEELKVSSVAKSLHRRLERKVISNADEVISVSPSWANDLAVGYQRRIQIITNGFDPSDFKQESLIKDQRMVMLHAGLLNSFRNPSSLWKALKLWKESNPQQSDKLSVVLAGIIDERIKQSIQKDEVLSSIVEFREYIPHDLLIECYHQSYILLLLLNKTKNQRGHIPGKLFEYLGARRYILLIGDPEGDSANIIKETKSGYSVDPENVEALAAILQQLSEAFDNKKTPEQEDISKYTRKELTRELVEILNSQ